MSENSGMLAVIANHACVDGVKHLLTGLRPHVETIALDSGSALAPEDVGLFARRLPNVYYNGLLNAACAEACRRGADLLYFICADVTLTQPDRAVRRAREAFASPDVGLYAPAMNASGHRHMRHRPGGAMRAVSFVEGACFAVRTALLTRLCPVDLTVNALGWGMDVHLGYLTWQARRRAVVDDAVLVLHRCVSGYDTNCARAQRDAWFARQTQAARRFRRVTGWAPTKTRPGWRVADAWLRWAAERGAGRV